MHVKDLKFIINALRNESRKLLYILMLRIFQHKIVILSKFSISNEFVEDSKAPISTLSDRVIPVVTAQSDKDSCNKGKEVAETHPSEIHEETEDPEAAKVRCRLSIFMSKYIPYHLHRLLF